ncbi:MAG TPA: MBL fold metallo-hydrolase [Myxococcota bacterium]|nr:MBL fold metallo-hydrolase [Myxococcota bacterium]
MRFIRILLTALGVLAVLVLVAGWYLLGRTPVPEKSDYALDLNEVRRLAGALPGDPPLRVNHEQVAVASLPKGAVFAAESPLAMFSFMTPHPMSHGAYQVVYPGGGFLMIDSAFDADMLKKMSKDAPFSSDAWTAIQRGLAGASHIVITHEHADHIGGIARFPEPEKLVGRVLLTEEQLDNAAMMKAAQVPESLQKAVTPLVYDKYYAVAPGVVLVKAPGHTPGSQMIYVRLAGGKELLFLGDVAWHMDQIRQLWYRPRLVTDYFIHENRAQVMAEFRTLHDLAEREPIQLVVSHDVDQRKELLASGVLGEHFEF